MKEYALYAVSPFLDPSYEYNPMSNGTSALGSKGTQSDTPNQRDFKYDRFWMSDNSDNYL